MFHFSKILSSRLVAPLCLTLAISASAQAQSGPKYGGVLIGDLRLDQVLLSRDLDGNGDADAADEVSVYFDAQNQSGLPEPTKSVFVVHRGKSGYVYVADGGSDTVYRLDDINYDGDAQDPGEAKSWFSEAENAMGFTLPTPNGVFERPNGDVYIVNAGVRSRPDDAVYLTRDLNGDGDANDVGEATRWLDLGDLASQVIGADPNVSSAFDIAFLGSTALIADTVGRETDVIFSARDRNRNGVIDQGELGVWLDADNVMGAPVSTGLTVIDDSVYVLESSKRAEQAVFRLRDLNQDGRIDGALEAQQVWDESLLPQGFEMGPAFGLTVSERGELYLTSAGGTGSDGVLRLVDLDGDGRFEAEGETIVWRSGNGDAAVEFARTLSVLPEFLSAKGYRAVSQVNDHNALPRDIGDIHALLSVIDDGQQIDFAAIQAIYEQGKNSIKAKGSVRTIAAFVDGVDGSKPEKNFENLFPVAFDYFGQPGFLEDFLGSAIRGEGRFAAASDKARAEAIKAGLYTALAYWVRFELRYSAYKAQAGNFACPKGAPHNWDEGFAFYYGPNGRYSLYAFIEALAKKDRGLRRGNATLLRAFRRGIRVIAPNPPELGQVECAPGAGQARFPTLEKARIEKRLARSFKFAMLSEIGALSRARSPEQRAAASARADAYYLAIAPEFSVQSPWAAAQLRRFFERPNPSSRYAGYIQWVMAIYQFAFFL